LIDRANLAFGECIQDSGSEPVAEAFHASAANRVRNDAQNFVSWINAARRDIYFRYPRLSWAAQVRSVPSTFDLGVS